METSKYNWPNTVTTLQATWMGEFVADLATTLIFGIFSRDA